MGSHNNNRFKSSEECTEYLKKIKHNNIKCIKYGGTFKSRSVFKCKIDDYEWESTLDAVSHSHSSGCPKCSNVAKITDVDEVNKWLKDNNKKIICEYYAGTTANSLSVFKCLIDGNVWNSKFNNIKNGKGCPVCSKVKRIKKIDEVNLWLNQNNRNIRCIEYCGNVINLSLFKCEICNKSWNSTFNNIKNGNSCPYCAASKGECLITNILDFNNIEYKSQYWFPDCRSILPLPFDFALFDNGKILGVCEYQGIQHYEPIDFANKGYEWALESFNKNQERDNIKRIYCKNNEIPLLEIPYWEYDNCEILLLDFINKIK